MSSTDLGIVITTIGATAVLTAVLGSRIRRATKVPSKPAFIQKATPIVSAPKKEAEPLVDQLPPPPPSKTSGLHFAPPTAGALTASPPRRHGGTYVRRTAPKRSTATRQRPEDPAS